MNPKGGTGKTLTSKLIATSEEFRKTYNKIAFVELDAQRSIGDWLEERRASKLPTLNVFHETIFIQELLKEDQKKGGSSSLINGKIVSRVKELTQKYDCLVIDSPGESLVGDPTSIALAITMGLKGVLIVPMRMSETDTRAFNNIFYKTLKEKYCHDQTAYILPSQINPSNKSETIVRFFEQGCIDPNRSEADQNGDGQAPNIQILSTVIPYYADLAVYDRYGRTLKEYCNILEKPKQVGTKPRKLLPIEKAEICVEKLATHFISLTQ